MEKMSCQILVEANNVDLKGTNLHKETLKVKKLLLVFFSGKVSPAHVSIIQAGSGCQECPEGCRCWNLFHVPISQGFLSDIRLLEALRLIVQRRS